MYETLISFSHIAIAIIYGYIVFFYDRQINRLEKRLEQIESAYKLQQEQNDMNALYLLPSLLKYFKETEQYENAERAKKLIEKLKAAHENK